MGRSWANERARFRKMPTEHRLDVDRAHRVEMAHDRLEDRTFPLGPGREVLLQRHGRRDSCDWPSRANRRSHFGQTQAATPSHSGRPVAVTWAPMAVQLNHTIVWCTDKQRSAAFATEILGLPPAVPFGPFMIVELDNDVSIDFH